MKAILPSSAGGVTKDITAPKSLQTNQKVFVHGFKPFIIQTRKGEIKHAILPRMWWRNALHA